MIQSGQKPNVCYAFLRGECNRGSACRFNHPMDQDPNAPTYGSPPDPYAPIPQHHAHMPPPSYRPTPGYCFAFQRGECFRGDSCKYSHAAGPGAGMPPPQGSGGDFAGYGGAYQQPSRKPCFAFQQGECVHGDNCRFAHISADGRVMSKYPQQRPSRKPCFAFLNTGICERGDACRFSHDAGALSMPPPGPGASMFLPMPMHMSMPMGDSMNGLMGSYGSGGGGGGLHDHGHGYNGHNGHGHGHGHHNSSNPPVCFAFQRGQCSRGESCRFAHIAATSGGATGGSMEGGGDVSSSSLGGGMGMNMGGGMGMGGMNPVGVGVPIPSTAAATSGAYDQQQQYQQQQQQQQQQHQDSSPDAAAADSGAGAGPSRSDSFDPSVAASGGAGVVGSYEFRY